MYDYKKNITSAVIDYIETEIKLNEFETLEKLKEHLHNTLYLEDSVTGNGSGSYTFNTLQAKENLEGNEELYKEAVEQFAIDYNIVFTMFFENPEAADVIIRCYLLDECIDEALETLDLPFGEC